YLHVLVEEVIIIFSWASILTRSTTALLLVRTVVVVATALLSISIGLVVAVIVVVVATTGLRPNLLQILRNFILGLSHNFHQITSQRVFGVVNEERICMSLVLFATSATNSVHVCFNVVGHVKVDDHIHIVNVQTPSSYICCN